MKLAQAIIASALAVKVVSAAVVPHDTAYDHKAVPHKKCPTHPHDDVKPAYEQPSYAEPGYEPEYKPVDKYTAPANVEYHDDKVYVDNKEYDLPANGPDYHTLDEAYNDYVKAAGEPEPSLPYDPTYPDMTQYGDQVAKQHGARPANAIKDVLYKVRKDIADKYGVEINDDDVKHYGLDYVKPEHYDDVDYDADKYPVEDRVKDLVKKYTEKTYHCIEDKYGDEHTKPDTGYECIKETEACDTYADECCEDLVCNEYSKTCVKDEQCVKETEACDPYADECCEDLVCNEYSKTCVKDEQCIKETEACDPYADECCEDLVCNEDSKTCVKDEQCVKENEKCKPYDSKCCDGFVCNEYSKTCVKDEQCVKETEACDPYADECCEGFVCNEYSKTCVKEEQCLKKDAACKPEDDKCCDGFACNEYSNKCTKKKTRI